jgi:hypothetical protein
MNTGDATLVRTAVITNIVYSTLRGGQEGGGIANYGTLKLVGAAVGSNSGHLGAGLYNAGVATITASLINSNVTSNDGYVGPNSGFGGGIFNDGGTITLVGGTVISNHATAAGGGIFNARGTVDTVATVFLKNTPQNCAPSGSVSGCA